MNDRVFILCCVILIPLALSGQNDKWIKRGLEEANYTKQIEYFTISITKEDYDALAYLYRAQAKYELEDYIGALEDFDKSIYLDSRNSYSYSLRGMVKLDLEDAKGAISDFNEAIKLDPENAFAYNFRGGLRAFFEDFQGAIEDFTKAIEYDPRYAGLSYYNRGLAKDKIYDYKGAIEDYNKAIDFGRNDAATYFDRGMAKLGINDIYGATEDFLYSISLNPKFIRNYQVLNDIYFEQAKYDKAIDINIKGLKQEPQNTLLLVNLAYSYFETGDYENSIYNFKKCLESDDKNFDAAIGLTASYYSLDDMFNSKCYWDEAKKLESRLTNEIESITELRQDGLILSDKIKETLINMLETQWRQSVTKEPSYKYTERSTGTGFSISEDGLIVTCFHIIDGAVSIKVKGINGDFSRIYSATILLTDEINDIALLRIDDYASLTFEKVPFLLKSSISDVGTDIFVLGYPLTATMGEEIKLTNGIISAESGFMGDNSSYQISAPVQQGNSGAPLFDKDGYLIGIVNAKHSGAENAGYAIKAIYLASLIKSLSPFPNSAHQNLLVGRPLSDQVKILKKFVYIIESSTLPTIQQDDYWFQKGVSATDPQEKIDYYCKSIEIEGAYSVTYYNRGIAYYEIGQLEKAIADYSKVVEINPRNIDAYFNRGIAYNELGLFEKSIADYSKMIEIDPRNIDAYFNRGTVYSQHKNYEMAINDLTVVIEIDSIFSKAYNNRGYVYTKLGNYEKAIDDYSTSIAIDPRNSDFHLGRGNVYYFLEQYNKAITDFTRAIELDPKNSNAYYNRGNSYYKLVQYEKAIYDYTKAIEIDQKSADAYYSRGNSNLKLGNYQKAISDYSKMIEIEPKNADAYYNRGVVYEILGQYEKARADYNKSQELESK